MRDYELMVILRPDLEEEALQGALEKIRGIITGNGGAIEKEDAWGKRRFAYEIKRHREGVYHIFNFKAEPAVEQELKRVLKIDDTVLRSMAVRPGA